MRKNKLQHQVYPPPIITAQEYEALLFADKQASEEYKRQRSEYWAEVRAEGYRLAVGREFVGEDG